MKKITFIILLFHILYGTCFSQGIEKIGEIKEIIIEGGIAGGPGSPNEIAVNEVEAVMKIINQTSEYEYFDLKTLKGIQNKEYRDSYATTQIELNGIDISYTDDVLIIEKNSKKIQYIAGHDKIKSGISFILKKNKEYIVYYVNEDGYPGAIDTTGRIYSSEDAMEYLKSYDPEKYTQSEKRAADLGLYNDFIRNRILIWGETYFTTTHIMEKFYGKNDPYIINGEIQYDNLGYGYQIYFSFNNFPSNVCIVNPNGTRNTLFNIRDYSLILSTYEDFITSYYVGFGGNIYYYISCKDYTEVFRIRRTWGEPDFYAMAINGYTDDEYGKYVNEVLPKMSKADLRLLRNTIFALYGVHFKSEDLSKHFDKQVWYTDEGKTSADIQLPTHRQKLVEMIQALERK